MQFNFFWCRLLENWCFTVNYLFRLFYLRNWENVSFIMISCTSWQKVDYLLVILVGKFNLNSFFIAIVRHIHLQNWLLPVLKLLWLHDVYTFVSHCDATRLRVSLTRNSRDDGRIPDAFELHKCKEWQIYIPLKLDSANEYCPAIM